jgi:hypothetical protein
MPSEIDLPGDGRLAEVPVLLRATTAILQSVGRPCQLASLFDVQTRIAQSETATTRALPRAFRAGLHSRSDTDRGTRSHGRPASRSLSRRLSTCARRVAPPSRGSARSSGNTEKTSTLIRCIRISQMFVIREQVSIQSARVGTTTYDPGGTAYWAAASLRSSLCHLLR